jgi:hypothetical protein
MDLLIEALKAVGQIVFALAAILIAPLIFMVVFSLVSGFNEGLPDDE